eukprot:761825-Hanusia_phi.AAC.1
MRDVVQQLLFTSRGSSKATASSILALVSYDLSRLRSILLQRETRGLGLVSRAASGSLLRVVLTALRQPGTLLRPLLCGKLGNSASAAGGWWRAWVDGAKRKASSSSPAA